MFLQTHSNIQGWRAPNMMWTWISCPHYKLISYMSNHQAWGKEVATGMPKVWLEFESHNWIFLMSPGDIPSRFRDTRTAEKKNPISHKDYDPFLRHQNWLFLIESRAPSMSISNRYFKTNHDVFLTKLFWKLQQKDTFLFNISFILVTRLLIPW